MALAVSGTSSNQALLQLNSAQSTILKASQQLSSGQAINSSADNPSGAAIAAFLQAGVNGTDQATQNDLNAQNAVTVAEGTAASVESNVQTLNTLAVQGGNGLLTQSDQNIISNEAQQVTQQINTETSQTQFNGVPLLQGNSVTVQSGANEGNTTTVNTPNTSAGSLGLESLNFSSQSGSEAAISGVQNAIQNLGSQQAELGSQQVAIGEQINNNNVLSNNLQASESNVADANVGQASTKQNAGSIQSQIATSVLSTLQKDNSGYTAIFANHTA